MNAPVAGCPVPIEMPIAATSSRSTLSRFSPSAASARLAGGDRRRPRRPPPRRGAGARRVAVAASTAVLSAVFAQPCFARGRRGALPATRRGSLAAIAASERLVGRERRVVQDEDRRRRGRRVRALHPGSIGEPRREPAAARRPSPPRAGSARAPRSGARRTTRNPRGTGGRLIVKSRSRRLHTNAPGGPLRLAVADLDGARARGRSRPLRPRAASGATRGRAFGACSPASAVWIRTRPSPRRWRSSAVRCLECSPRRAARTGNGSRLWALTGWGPAASDRGRRRAGRGPSISVRVERP